MSSTEDPSSHFVVEQGAYAPRDIPDLEITDGSNRAYLGVPWPYWDHTPSTRLASIRRGRGWFCFRF